MNIFWVVAGVLSAAAAGLILQRASKAARTPEPADPALGLYRRQLDEIDDLAARGLLPEDERRTAHAEAARRLLGAADRGRSGLEQRASPALERGDHSPGAGGGARHLSGHGLPWRS